MIANAAIPECTLTSLDTGDQLLNVTGEDLSSFADLLSRRKRSLIEEGPIILNNGDLFPLLDLISKVEEQIDVEKSNSISSPDEDTKIKGTEVN